MDTDLISQLSAALVPLLGAVCGYLAGKLRAAAKRAKEKDAADQKQQAALVDGVKSLLRGQIIDDAPPRRTGASLCGRSVLPQNSRVFPAGCMSSLPRQTGAARPCVIVPEPTSQ